MRKSTPPKSPFASLAQAAVRPGAGGLRPPSPAKAVGGGLLRLCEEIAGTLLRRRLESGDAVGAVRWVRSELVAHLPDCDEARAGRLVDLALELLHVKARGRFRRNPLELSELIAYAGRQLRAPEDN
jgi:hypothetical protein